MKRVVCFGDSITFGEHVPTSDRWTTILAERRPEWNVLTRGVCADTTRLGLERFTQDVELASPDVLVIQFGHNDCNSWNNGMPRVTLLAYAANLIEMVRKGRKAGAQQVVVCTPHRTSYPNGYEQRLRKYASAAREAALKANADVMDANAHDAIPLLGDGLHLSRAGHQFMAHLVMRTIRS